MKRLQWLEDQLDREDLSLALRRKYEIEADQLAIQMTREAVSAKQRDLEMKAELEKLGIEAVDSSLRDLAVSVAGPEWNTWLEKSLKLYTIGEGFTVTSIADGPNNPQSWECDTMLQAKQKILQLIRWKYRDHFIRGNTFAYDPDLTEGK